MIKKGQKFKCIKDKIPWFIKGRVYRPKLDGSLRSETGAYYNLGSSYLLELYFILYISNKRGYVRKEGKKV